jgi:hypothetical protein
LSDGAAEWRTVWAAGFRRAPAGIQFPPPPSAAASVGGGGEQLGRRASADFRVRWPQVRTGKIGEEACGHASRGGKWLEMQSGRSRHLCPISLPVRVAPATAIAPFYERPKCWHSTENSPDSWVPSRHRRAMHFHPARHAPNNSGTRRNELLNCLPFAVLLVEIRRADSWP